MEMGEPSLQQQNVCPSCGTEIAGTATRCEFCKSALGHCPQCRTWLVAGTVCIECDKMAVSAAPKKRSSQGVDIEEPYVLIGSPFGLILPLLVRLALSAAFLGSLVLAVAQLGVAPLAEAAKGAGVDPASGGPFWWVGVGASLILLVLVNNWIRGYRLARTYLFGKPLERRGGVAGLILQPILSVLILAVTAGLGLPWLYARNRRLFYRRWVAPSRAARPLDFAGAGEEVIGKFLLTLVCIPAAVCTAGLAYPVISWVWLKWDHSKLVVPDRFGGTRKVKFYGTFGAYYVRALLGWALTLVTAGIYRPFALWSEWRWAAEQVDADDSRRTRVG